MTAKSPTRRPKAPWTLPFICPLLMAVLSMSAGCAASRAPIPPGEVPSGSYVTPEDEAYGLEVLRRLSQQYPIEQNDRDVNRVRDLVDMLANAAHASSSPWNVYVLRGDDVINAAATRGNFVFVWTGMLQAAYSDAELATVLAHELGHVLANHTQATPDEEASEIIATVSGNVARGVISAQGAYGALGQVAGMLVAETVRALAVNPESQRQELEADQIGLFLMADAGFDPTHAIDFWVRFSQQHGDSSAGLQFFSSHPANQERIEALEALLPAAMERYRQATGSAPRRKPAPTSTRSPKPDSFAVGANAGSSTSEPWVVTEISTALRQEPDDFSPLVRDLPQGEQIFVGEQQGRWFEVLSPVHGFVRGRDIAPESIARGRR